MFTFEAAQFPQDFDLVVSLIDEVDFDEEGAPKDMAKIRYKAAEWLHEGQVFFIKHHQVECAGIIMLSRDELWWSSTPFYVNALMYVRPVYRNLGLLRRIIRFCEQYAIINEGKFLPNFAFVKDLERKRQMIHRLGYTSVIETYKKS